MGRKIEVPGSIDCPYSQHCTGRESCGRIDLDVYIASVEVPDNLGDDPLYMFLAWMKLKTWGENGRMLGNWIAQEKIISGEEIEKCLY